LLPKRDVWRWVMTALAARKIRTRLDTGMLPREALTRMWVGGGTGECCHGCDETIAPTHVLYGLVSEGRALHFHHGCARLWEDERRRSA
jgi:hypothetical protein